MDLKTENRILINRLFTDAFKRCNGYLRIIKEQLLIKNKFYKVQTFYRKKASKNCKETFLTCASRKRLFIMIKERTMENKFETLKEYIVGNQAKFYRLAYSFVLNQEAALDVVQNAILKALENYQSIRDMSYLSTWFYRVLVNECYAYLKTSKRIVLYTPEAMPEECYLEKAYECYQDEVFREVVKLPKKIRTVIILRFYEELSLNEISEITKTNLSTVKTRLYTGLKKLKVSLKEWKNEPF